MRNQKIGYYSKTSTLKQECKPYLKNESICIFNKHMYIGNFFCLEQTH